jgi:hypothetical protein
MTSITGPDLLAAMRSLSQQGIPSTELIEIYHSLRNGNNGITPDIEFKINEIIEGIDKRERNVSQEIYDWLLEQDGWFNVVSVYNDLKLTTKENKAAARKNLERFVKKELVQKHPDRAGIYRRRDKTVKKMDFLEVDDAPFEVELPFYLSTLVNLALENVVIFAGEKSTGKTATMLNIAQLNAERYSGLIDYWNSEASSSELKKRLKMFSDHKLEWWHKHVNFYKRKRNFQDVVRPEAKITIIDYLTLHDEFYKMSGLIEEIGDRARDGIVFIAMQKNKGGEWARGGNATIDLSRLYCNMEKNIDGEGNTIKIIDCKDPKVDYSVNNMTCEYKLVKGSRIFITRSWERPEQPEKRKKKEKYGDF